METGPRPTISISAVSVTEGDLGTTPFTAMVTMYGWNGSITVSISATPGTADLSDYVFTTTQLTFTGSGLPQTVSGLIIGDTNPEGDEYFTLTATPVTEAGYPYVSFYNGTVTIIDDDQAHASQLHVEGVSLLEGDQGTTMAEVRVLLEPASTNTVTVSYQTADVTATAGTDYLAASGMITFAPGEVLKTIPITILGDTDPESDETFAIVLSQPTMALLGTFRAEVAIANDDGVVMPVVEPARDAGPILVATVDADSGKANPDAGTESEVFLSASSSDVQPVSDSGIGSGLGADSGVSTSQTGDFGVAPGCSCSVTRHANHVGLLLLALLGIPLVRARRHRGR